MVNNDAKRHKDLVREQFSYAADAFASSPYKSDMDYRRQYAAYIDPPPGALVLDIATGPGYQALVFADTARLVVGIDITPEMLLRAVRNRDGAALGNVKFSLADAECLPFADDTFDVVSCNASFHHFTNPGLVLKEMARVCRPGGRVAIDDMVDSEEPNKASLHNHIERMRDPSHTRCLPLSELLSLVELSRLRVERFEISETLRDFQEWMDTVGAMPATVAEVRKLMLDSISGDAAGMSVGLNNRGRLTFIRTGVWLVARKAGRRTVSIPEAEPAVNKYIHANNFLANFSGSP